VAVEPCVGMREGRQGRQSFLKGDARQDAIREGGGDSARDGSGASGPGPARPDRERGAGRAGQSHKARTEETCRDGPGMRACGAGRARVM